MSNGFKILLFLGLLFAVFWAQRWRSKELRLLLVDGLEGPQSSSEFDVVPSRGGVRRDTEVSPVLTVLRTTNNLLSARWAPEDDSPEALLPDPEEQDAGIFHAFDDSVGDADEEDAGSQRSAQGAFVPERAPGEESVDGELFIAANPRFTYESESGAAADLLRRDSGPLFGENTVRVIVTPRSGEQGDVVRAKESASGTPGDSDVGGTNSDQAVPQGSVEVVHVVEDKETLWKIAGDYFGKGYYSNRIVAWNEISDPNRVRPGTRLRLIVPDERGVLRPQKAVKKAARVKTTSQSPARKQAMIVHKVAEGDTLIKIARRYFGGAAGPESWREIYDANRGVIKDPHSLIVGRSLTIPSRLKREEGPAVRNRG